MTTTLPKHERVDWNDLELEVAHLSVGGVAITTGEIAYLDGISLGTGAASKAVVLDTGEDYIWPATGQLTYGGTAITATGLEINTMCDAGSKLIFHGDIDSYTFLVANSGSVSLIGDVTGVVAFTLPLAFAGGVFSLLYIGDVAEGDNHTITTTSDELYAGGLGFLDEDAGAGDGVDTVLPTSSADLITLVNVQPPTRIDFYSDGTKWYVSGTVWSDTVPTFTTP